MRQYDLPRSRKTAAWVLLRAVLAVLACAGAASADPPFPSPEQDLRGYLRAQEQIFARLAEQVRPSVVAIRTYRTVGSAADAGGASVARLTNSHGSGVILRPDGTILTNDHVLADANVIKVGLSDGTEHEARLIERDVRSDMAVIRIEGVPSLQPAVLGDTLGLRVGQWCFVAGNPFGIAFDDAKPAVTFGNISALGRNLTHQLDATDTRYYGDLIQTSSAINPGNSGGPLFDLEGRMIGVVTAIVSRSGMAEGMGFAIPLNERTRRIIDMLTAGTPVRYGYLGVSVDTPRRSDGRRGAVITGISDSEGPSAKADLRTNDLITEFDGEPIQDSDQLIRVVGATPVGSNAQVRYLRDGEPRETTVHIGQRPMLDGPRAASSDSGVRTLAWRGTVLAEMDDATLRIHGVQRADAGIVVVSLDQSAASRRAGLSPGDVILAYNGARVRNLAEFLEADRREARAIRLDLKGGRTARLRR